MATLAALSLVWSAQAANSNPNVISGTLTGMNGQPEAGYVGLTAYPDPLPTNKGSGFDMVQVATKATAPDGSYTFTAADIENSPAFDKLKTIAAGWGNTVNFDVMGQVPGASGDFNTPLNMIVNSAGAASFSTTGLGVSGPTNIAATTVEPASYFTHAVVQPNDPPPYCHTDYLGQQVGLVRVGETHRWNGVGMCSQPGIHTHAAAWLGNLVQGSGFDNARDGACTLFPGHVPEGAGAYRKSTGTALHYSVAVNVFGAALGANTGFDSNARYYYWLHTREYICGATGNHFPAGSSYVAVGPQW
ncbi:MAG: hypothetical protein ACR2KG_01955 [Nocardioidaceae bacterium]